MSLQELGWNAFFHALRGDRPLRPARVISQGSDRFLVNDGYRESVVSVRGRLREQAHFPPVVGDWVGLTAVNPAGSIDDSSAIEEILERRTTIVRKQAGRTLSAQPLAANVDRVLLVTALDQDFSLHRLERYLTLVWESGATPLIVLSKADLVDDPSHYVHEAEQRAPGFPVVCVSNVSGKGQERLASVLRSGETIVLLGSSGVGKSSLVNALGGAVWRATGVVRKSDGKGRHTTTDRHLVCLPSGVLVIDSPGLREVQLWADESSVGQTFSEITEIAGCCRFRDCGHNGEPGCAVAEAVDQGEIDPERLHSFHRLRAEVDRLQRQTDPRRASQYKSEVKKLHRAQKQQQRMSKKP